ncbi:hypothetical protein [Proteus mirabilis]|uniref:hypothetical protein n=1 Tax=Proteus mirabilis TaxID=584 RepID=UPI00163D10F3|nr:hypothetical protein [Proteus mirabilis]MDF7457351.1 hypothetical protein [Proteus mirabilis]QNH66870.1 hypothetical protein H7F13_06430 [Proteus vulgaris]
MEIKIPDSCDNEWQAKMLRKLSFKLGRLKECNDETRLILLIECDEIVDALREYSGY